jgi:short-subunit dehydrogenase involved in D-alanine esterification of teichoic acids
MMPLKDFIFETMQLLKTQPTPAEINVERVKGLRFAEATGSVDKVLEMLSHVSLGDERFGQNHKVEAL